jgi:hypothetical protein
MALKSFYETQWGIARIPFPRKGAYSEGKQFVFVPEIFGEQWNEFRQKFFLAPLENQSLMGAVWSLTPRDPKARGYGKSTLMGESAKLVNADLGLSTLVDLEVSDRDARANPILASYASFTASAYGAIANMDAVGFELLMFLLRQESETETSLHIRLRERAIARLIEQGINAGETSSALEKAVRQRVRKGRIPIDIRGKLQSYLEYLVSEDTESLNEFLGEEVGTWHHDRNGLKYLQLFVVFAELAGVEHLTFFVDQVEDFTSLSGSAKIQKNVKIIRDALIENEPFVSSASFVFQLHPVAYEAMRLAWEHEDLPSLAHDDPLNQPAVVVLKGLETFDAARVVVEKYLNHPTIARPNHKGGITPFTETAVRQIFDATRPIPRNFLTVLHDVMRLGHGQKLLMLHEAFVEKNIKQLLENASEELFTDEDDARLA